MVLTLSDEDARTLRDWLTDNIRELRLEVARTDARDFRHVLVLRQDLVERLIAQLEGALAPPAASAGRKSKSM